MYFTLLIYEIWNLWWCFFPSMRFL